jgi:hypothetical protein
MNPEENETPVNIRAEILSDLWLNFRNDGEFQDFVEYNDLGLPLAYAVSSGIVPATEKAQEFINETFLLLLAALDIEEDTSFDSLDEILAFQDEVGEEE